MANLGVRGWRVDTYKAVTLSGDCTKGLVATISDASTNPPTVTDAGAGEMPEGVYTETVDVSEEGYRSQVATEGLVVCTAAAAVTDTTVPLKCAASGQVTPCDTDQDVIIGKATHTCDSGDLVQIDLALMGSYYATT
jgi:hypothetical protein